ncbi:hypothetical protein NPX13_g5883 [Xylaria arbuscula]|uniref:J domain-containing protein n=1 Tax=Xylaria arbuscula TaxID=114810 RepID=A0A9W8TKM1_9PEZI|nr:hypothetical protein NPX13_g5883 [Xylaria arbuscula]
MSNPFLSLLGWAFLPNMVTGWVQAGYYHLTIRAGDPHPPPNSPRWQLHRRRIHALVITLYLLYTIYEAHWELQRAGSFYTSLNMPFDAVDRDIKSRFRRLAAQHHPDKVAHSSSSTAAGAQDAGTFFMHLKTASDVLTTPVHRFAYDRFGPDILTWRNCSTLKDFVWRGLQQQILLHYALAAAGLWGLGFLGYFEVGRYWRWLTLVSLCVFEVHVVMRPQFPHLYRHRTTGPYTPRRRDQEAAADEKLLQRNLDRLEQTSKLVDSDCTRLMELEMAPFAGDAEAVKDMRGKLKEWLVQNTIRADPMVRDAMGQSLQRRRVDAPAGAKGTK